MRARKEGFVPRYLVPVFQTDESSEWPEPGPGL
jgi:hypothetical protein